MSTVHIILRDTDSGLVDVETTISEGWTNSNAVALAGRLNDHLSDIASQQGPVEDRSAPKLELVKA